jgi:hypothetical protein
MSIEAGNAGPSLDVMHISRERKGAVGTFHSTCVFLVYYGRYPNLMRPFQTIICSVKWRMVVGLVVRQQSRVRHSDTRAGAMTLHHASLSAAYPRCYFYDVTRPRCGIQDKTR